MADKIYCGNGKKITTRFGDMMRLSLSETDIQALQDNLDKGWVNVKVCERREPSQSGMTHYLEVDTWKPGENRDGDGAVSAKAPKKAVQTDEVSAEDLPF
jgi:hypothetical protein